MPNGGWWDAYPQVQTVGCIQISPLDNSWPAPTYPQWNLTVPQPPTECSGDVHVFPCQRCNTCKCGKATLAEPK
jgi:hypothetical protein